MKNIRKIWIILMLILLLMGCVPSNSDNDLPDDKDPDDEPQIEDPIGYLFDWQIEFEVNNENETIKIIAHFDDDLAFHETIEFGILYLFTNEEINLHENYGSINKYTKYTFSSDLAYTIHDIDSVNYNINLKVRLYYITDGYVFYSNISTFNLYEQKKNDSDPFAIKIKDFVEGNTTVTSIELIINYENYTITSKPEYLNIQIAYDYKEVILTITPTDSKYRFNENISLVINKKNQNIKFKTIENNILTIKFNDPNWSGIY